MLHNGYSSEIQIFSIMKYFLFITFLIFAANTYSQDCSASDLAKKPGIWKAGLKGSTTNVSAADLTREKAVLTVIHQMISSGYTPKGCQALYSYSYSGANPYAGKNWVGDQFWYSIYILRYLCDRNSADKSKYYIDAATPTTVNIYSNVIFWLNALYAADLADEDPRGYLKLQKKPQLKEGFYFMGEEIVGDSHMENKIIEYRWLITYDEKLPFSYVSRKEYLLLVKKRLEQTISNNQGSRQFYVKYMNRIMENLNMPEAVLGQPAICMWNDEEQFEGFVEEGTRGSFIAIKPNLDYYNKKLAKSVPQFFSVAFKIAHGDPVFEENISGIKNAADFNVLRKMLGK